MTMTAEQFNEILRMHSTWIADFESGVKSPTGSQLQLEAATVCGASITKMNCTSASLNCCRFEDCTFSSCIFDSSELIQTRYVKCVFDRCSFMSADLRECDASGCSFVVCNFTRADLTDARLLAAEFIECVFDYSWFIRTDLRHAVLDNISKEHLRIDHAKLFNVRGFNLTKADEITGTKVDFSEEGDGSMLIDWPDVLNRLSTPLR